MDSQPPEIARINFDIPRVEKEWLVLTEVCRRQLKNNTEQHPVDGNNAVADVCIGFLSKVPNEELPEEFYRAINEQVLEPDSELQKVSRFMGTLPNFLEIPPTPEEEYNYYGALRAGSHLSNEKVDRILRRSRYARDVKLLALAAEMKVVDEPTLQQEDEFITPHGVKVKINPALNGQRESILDPSSWELRRVIKDRVHLAVIGGKEYILKERKSHRHSDVAGTNNRQIRFGNTSEQEFDLAMGITNAGTIHHGDIIIGWERPVAFVKYPDPEETQLVLFEKIPDAIDIADYKSRANSEKMLVDLTTQLAELIIQNEHSYSQEMQQRCEQAVEQYASIGYWDSDKYPAYFEQMEALEQNPDPESMRAEEINFREYAYILATRMVLSSSRQLDEELLLRGYYNEDHEGKSERLFSVNVTDERAKLNVHGIDLEYAKKVDDVERDERLTKLRERQADFEKRNVHTGLYSGEVALLRNMGIEPTKKHRALGEAMKSFK